MSYGVVMNESANPNPAAGDAAGALERLEIADDRAGWVHHRLGRAPLSMAPGGHRHAELELNLVLAGHATYLVDGRREAIATDSLLWLLPSQRHLLLDRSRDFEMWIAVFRPGVARAAGVPAGWVSLDGGGSDGFAAPDAPAVSRFARRLSESQTAALAATCERLAGSGGAALSPPHHAAGLAWLLCEARAAFAGADGVAAGSHLHPAVERAARWLHDHAHEPAAEDFDALAARAGVSRWWLSRLFKRQVGASLTDYRNRRRVERALALLGRGGRHTAAEAAYASGFGSYAQFYRAFRAHTGESPERHLRRG